MLIEIQFTAEPIVVPPQVLPSREIGAVVEFQGLVRELENGAALEGLFYGTVRFPDQQLERHDLPRPAAVRARLAAWGGGDWNLVHEPGEESEAVALDSSEMDEDEDDPFDHDTDHPDVDDAEDRLKSAHRHVSETPKEP